VFFGNLMSLSILEKILREVCSITVRIGITAVALVITMSIIMEVYSFIVFAIANILGLRGYYLDLTHDNLLLFHSSFFLPLVSITSYATTTTNVVQVEFAS
jgi:hypothetical protein